MKNSFRLLRCFLITLTALLLCFCNSGSIYAKDKPPNCSDKPTREENTEEVPPADIIDGSALYAHYDFDLDPKSIQDLKAIRLKSEISDWDDEHIIIYCDKPLYNFKIFKTTYSDEKPRFKYHFDELVFSIDELPSGFYIEYVTYTPDGIPSEAISFTDSSGAKHSYMLNGGDESGEIKHSPVAHKADISESPNVKK
jgi:hypothetical protein